MKRWDAEAEAEAARLGSTHGESGTGLNWEKGIGLFCLVSLQSGIRICTIDSIIIQLFPESVASDPHPFA